MKTFKIVSGNINKTLLILNIFIALFYFTWWFLPGNKGEPLLYNLLLFGEIYHLFMALTFWHTLWPTKKMPETTFFSKSFKPTVDIFIPVTGEPVDVVYKTIVAAKKIDYDNLQIYILNDSYVARKENWREIIQLAKKLNVNCITRKTAGGAKAGNINNALRQSSGEMIAIFDADMMPYTPFLKQTLPYFEDESMGFVQTPQYYKNYGSNAVTAGAWEQQELFFGPIMKGKDNTNSAFLCGTNFVIRRRALEDVGGMYEGSIAEDFVTSLLIHAKRWRSRYINTVLSEGLAPQDLEAYFKQQLRWAKGSLEVVFGGFYLFKKGLSLRQRIEYLSSSLYYFNGVIVLIDMFMPFVFLFWGTEPVSATTTSFALFFIPFMFINLYSLSLASGEKVSFRAIAFSSSSWPIQCTAFLLAILRIPLKFSVTPKKKRNKSFFHIALPHILYICIGIIASGFGIAREGANASVITNIVWVTFNAVMFIPFIRASYKKSVSVTEDIPVLQTVNIAVNAK